MRTRSRSAWKHWPEVDQMILAHQLASRPDLFSQNLTQSARTKSDPAWFCKIRSRLFVEEHNRVWKWETGSRLVAFCQKLGLMVLAHRLASGLDAFGQNLTRLSRSDPGRFCTIWSRPSLENQNRIWWGKLDPAYTIWPDSGCMLATMTITGRNQNASQSDLARILGTDIRSWCHLHRMPDTKGICLHTALSSPLAVISF